MYTYGRQTISTEDIQAVVRILKSDRLTQGPESNSFEQGLCKATGAKFASAVNSGTAALHLIARAMNWSKDSVVITTPMSFVATANCVEYVGATPVFVDIEPQTHTLDPNRVEDKIIELRANCRDLRAIIVVDYAGHPADWKAFRTLADRFELQLINDGCHSLGASYLGNSSYAVEFADAVALSFHPVKAITCGEGGAVLTNNPKTESIVRNLREHGICREDEKINRHQKPWFYEMRELGFNYRISDIASALGLSQLRRLPCFIRKRRELAAYYQKKFAEQKEFTMPFELENCKDAYHLFPVCKKFKEGDQGKKIFFQRAKDKGILLQTHYIPIHLHPYYKKQFGYKWGDFPVAEDFYASEVSLPMYYDLTIEDINYIAEEIIGISME